METGKSLKMVTRRKSLKQSSKKSYVIEPEWKYVCILYPLVAAQIFNKW